MRPVSSGNIPAPDTWSHPGVPLFTHLVETMENTRVLIHDIAVPKLSFIPNSKFTFCQLAEICSALHDIGKGTMYFQRYIRGDTRVNKSLRSHSKLGSVYAFWAVINSPSLQHWEDEERLLVAFIVSVIVRTHHGDLRDLLNERKNLRSALSELAKKRTVYEQLISADPAKMDAIVHGLSRKLPIELPPWSSFASLSPDQFNKLKKKTGSIATRLRNIKNDCSSGRSPPFSFDGTVTLQLLFSLLQESDKTNAMGKNLVPRFNTDYFNLLNTFYSMKFGSSTIEPGLKDVVGVRPLIFTEVLNHSQSLPLAPQNRVFSLEAPTGSGKTLACLGWAFRLRRRIQVETRKIPRVLYILPFTSIIEQTHSVLSDILGKQMKEAVKHHYLSKLEFGDSEDNDLKPNERLFFIEGWNGEIILSTFVQFFHSIFTNKKKNLRKYAKFSNSIIILDEIQAFPPKYWGLFNTFLPKFLEMTNSYILMSTATLPGILDTPVTSISTSGLKAFSTLNRTSLHFIDGKYTPDELVPLLSAKGAFENVQSFLFVMNTISSAHLIFKEVRNHFPDAQVFYLSANIVPKHRTEVIQKVKCALESRKSMVFLVSTQVIEAGVDLSFDGGFRDLAPLDSIIQSAGRINRNNKSETQRCWVTTLVHSSTNRRLCTYIYDPLLITATHDLLKRQPAVHEKDYREIIGQYFRLVREKVKTSSKKLLASVCAGAYLSVSLDFQLIEDNPYKFPVFVELDEEAKELWNTYLRIRLEKDWETQRDLYAEIRPRLNQYIINVSAEDTIDLEDCGWIFRLEHDAIYFSYNLETGFVRVKDRDFLSPL